MKHVFLALCLLVTLSLSAQDRRGNFYLSGNTEFEYSKLGSERVNYWTYPTNLFQRFEGARFTSFRSGYFLTNRLLVGTRVDYVNAASDPNYQYNEEGALTVKPFLRYYFLDLHSAPLSFFGELGFATFGFGNATRYETDFHLGLGAELVLAPGVLGTANLNYDANADGVNYTNLTVGLNVLTGQLQGNAVTASLGRGTFSTTGRFGSIAYGRNQSGNNLDSDFRLTLTPRVGYFVLDGLMVEAAVEYTYNHYDFDRAFNRPFNASASITDFEAGVRARYYFLQRGRLLPFASAGIGYFRYRQEANGARGDLNLAAKSFVWQAGAGVSYFLSPQLALDLTAEYNEGDARLTNDSSVLGGGVSERQLRGSAGLRFFLPAR